MRLRGWTVFLGVVALSGCTFESSPGNPGAGLGGSSGGTTMDGSDTTPITDTTTGDSNSGTSQGSNPTDPTDPTDPSNGETTAEPTTGDPTDPGTGSTSSPSTNATIEISGDAFGTVDYESPANRDFMITNVGDEPAMALDISSTGPFSVESTDCGAALQPEESCGVRMRHLADTLGPFTGSLNADYTGGSAEEPLEVDVVGSTPNLAIDGDFEGCPDVAWTDVGPGSWVCGNPVDGVVAHGGSSYVAADTGPDDETYVLRLDLDVSAYANAIATGSMEFEFDGWARTYVIDDDEYRINVRYRDGDGQNIETYNTGWQTAGDWVHHEDVRTAPENIVEIRIDLLCRKDEGIWCDAYYDDITLIGRYGI